MAYVEDKENTFLHLVISLHCILFILIMDSSGVI